MLNVCTLQVFKLIDASDDGAISLGEFLKFAKRNSDDVEYVLFQFPAAWPGALMLLLLLLLLLHSAMGLGETMALFREVDQDHSGEVC